MNEYFFNSLQDFFNTVPANSVSDLTINAGIIDKWISITGPGSFTGIRIGLAALSGITCALKKDFAGLTSLDAAAILSGKELVTVAARIRMNEYAVRHYDFVKDIYSLIELKELYPPDGDMVFINGKINTVGYECLTRAINDPRVLNFLGEPAPVYVKKSEAEISFDKKGEDF